MSTVLGIPRTKRTIANVRQASQQYHGDLKTKLLDLYNRLALHGHGTLSLNAVTILCVIHLSNYDIPKADIAEVVPMSDTELKTALQKLRSLGLVENGSSLSDKWYYRPSARAIQMLNQGINRRINPPQ